MIEPSLSQPRGSVRTFVGRLGLTAGGQGLVFVLGIANQAVLTRALGAEGYGSYALVFTSGSLMGWLVGFGFQVATPAWVRGQAARARSLLALLAAYMTLLSAASALGWSVAPRLAARVLSASMPAEIGRWLYPSAVLALGYVLALGLLMGLVAFRSHALVSILNGVTLLYMNLRLALRNGDLVEAALSNVCLAYGVAITAGLVLVVAQIGIGRGTGWRVLLRDRSAATVRVYLGNLCRLVMLRVPFYAVERLFGTATLGRYALADYVMNVVWRPAGIAGQVLAANVATSNDQAGQVRVVAWLARALSAGTALALAIGLVAGARALEAVFGPEFDATYRILAVATPGIWAYAVFHALDAYYTALDYPWMVAGGFLLATAVALGGFMVGSSLGVVAVAASFAGGLVVLFALVGSRFRSECGVGWRLLLLPTPGDLRAAGRMLGFQTSRHSH